MHIEPPTRREISLAVFLLVSLLLFSRSRSNLEFSPLNRTFSAHNSTQHGYQVTAQNFRGLIRWGKGEVPQTKLVAHVPGELPMFLFSCLFIPMPLGWTIFDKLYLTNGTLFVVTDDASKIPDRGLMISTGYDIKNGDVEETKRVPTDKEMQIITHKDAKRLFGGDAELIDGVSVSSRGDVQM